MVGRLRGCTMISFRSNPKWLWLWWQITLRVWPFRLLEEENSKFKVKEWDTMGKREKKSRVWNLSCQADNWQMTSRLVTHPPWPINHITRVLMTSHWNFNDSFLELSPLLHGSHSHRRPRDMRDYPHTFSTFIRGAQAIIPLVYSPIFPSIHGNPDDQMCTKVPPRRRRILIQ